jgi:hypothetical protein
MNQLLEILVPMLLLAAVVAAITVRCVAAVFSPNVRSSIRRHPVAHACWLVGSLFAIAVLMAWLYPYIANRPRKANFSPEPTAAALSVTVVSGRFAARGFRGRSVSDGCGSAPC